MTDVRVQGGAGLYEVTLLTRRAARWVKRHVVTEPWQWTTADTFACDDSGYMARIVREMRIAKLAVD